MGVYIKGVTKSQLMKVIINSTKFIPDDFEVIEVKTPHGRLIDADALVTWDDSYGQRCTPIETIDDAPTVIEAEVG